MIEFQQIMMWINAYTLGVFHFYLPHSFGEKRPRSKGIMVDYPNWDAAYTLLDLKLPALINLNY